MKIIVESEELKKELIKESKYVHDFYIRIRGRKGRIVQWKGLDSNKAGILMHIYTNPDLIEVKE